MQTTFADGIANSAITSPLIRIEIGVATPTHTAEGKQELRMTQTQQVVMPLEGFVGAFAIQEQIIKKLIPDGVIRVQAPQPPSDAISTSALAR